MNALEPIHCEPRSYHKKNPRWYHSHIIDWMMANPNGKLEDCARFVGKTQPTLSAIIRSDMFQAALAQRKAQYAARQDLVLTDKLTQVAIASLDTILSVIDRKKDTLPLDTLNRVGSEALQRLGYGVKQEQPAVQVNVNNTQQVAVPVSREELDSARGALRQHQQKIASGSPQLALPPEASEAGAAAALGQEVLPPRIAEGGANPLLGGDLQKEAALVNGSEEDDSAPVLR